MSFLLTLFGGYILLTGAMFVLQRPLLYPAGGILPEVSRVGVPELHEVVIGSEDGLMITHWYRPPAEPSLPVFVVFHGNAGHIGDRIPKLQPLFQAGYGLFLAEYRGFGGNPGKPSEAALLADARLTLDWLAKAGIAPESIWLYGESLGTGVAVGLASERPVAGVILEAPYSSIADVAQAHYWYLPARWLLLDRWDSLSRIAEISAPLLVIHGERDRVVPIRFGRRLHAAAEEPKEALFLPHGDHNNLLDFPEVWARLHAFVAMRSAADLAVETVR